ncbi:CBR1 NADH-cytochrome b5 reductase 1 [Candida maltosa Xu316]|uniref:NADH-cytochrome b5 reductase n=1 Tax=Candida maltosa (strain Xu316) TaxID=1245528 RepID=M3J4N6_CANMX|nr:NADH-cytochrome b5 reductase 1 [Candida maltosa Xu316]
MSEAVTSSEPNPLLIFATIATIISSIVGYYFLQQSKKNKPVLKPEEFQKFPLIEKIKVSHNSAIYRFGLPKSTDRLGLPIGQHISIGATINGKEIVRSYTPISTDDQLGHFDLLIKTYENGNISKHVGSKNIGEHIDIRGPKGFFTYTPNMVKSFGMIAGGTGIAPMYQIITAILKNSEDKTKIHLVYANVTETDILLKKELDDFALRHPDRFKIHYVLNEAPAGWKGSIGFVTPEIIDTHLPKASNETNLLLCGPPPMISAMKKAAVGLGFEKAKPVSKLGDQIFVF